jgi:two-component system alkaline phosphatase synthesis response regulator PhoP
MSHRILLVDDEDDILEFVRYNLQREGYEVFTARDGAEGVARALEVHPHLILLDRMMPRMDGLETCRRLREHDELKDTMIVFLTALGEDEHQLTGFAAGADDYISKPIKMHILVSRLKAILKRIGAGDAAPRDTGGVTIDPARYIVKRNGEEISLPRKEFALLDLLYSSPGKLIPREEIYAKIWGTEVVVGDRTIDVHIRKLRQKIGDERIVTVKGVGYKYIPV